MNLTRIVYRRAFSFHLLKNKNKILAEVICRIVLQMQVFIPSNNWRILFSVTCSDCSIRVFGSIFMKFCSCWDIFSSVTEADY